MNPSLIADMLFTGALSTALVVGGVCSIWLLPWSTREQEGTARAMRAVARQAHDAVRSEVVVLRAAVAR
jgi:hypothetical protein